MSATVHVGDWQIAPDGSGWVVRERRVFGPESKRAGEVDWYAAGFYPSFRAALGSLLDRELRASDVATLEEVRVLIQAHHERLAALFDVDAETDDAGQIR